MSEEINNRKTGKGSRVAGARAKGAALAEAGKLFAQKYTRPNMAKAFREGFDSVLCDASKDDD